MKKPHLLFLCLLTAFAACFAANAEGELPGMTVGAYRYELPGAYAELCGRLTDGNVATRITIPVGKTVRVLRTDGEPMTGLYVTWYDKTPPQVTVTRLDASEKPLSGERVPGTSRHQYLPAGEDCFGIEFTSYKDSFTVAELLPVETEADIPFFSTEPVSPCDAAVFVTRPGEEYTLLGGMLPALVNYGLDVQVIYLEKAPRPLEESSFLALRELGVTREPVYWDLTAVAPESETDLAKAWKFQLKKISAENVLTALSPTLIVAPDGTDTSLSVEQRATGLIVSEGFENAMLPENARLMLVTGEDGPLSSGWTGDGRNRAAALYERFTTEWLYHRKIPQSVHFRFADAGALSQEHGPVGTELLLPIIFFDKTLKMEAALADGTPLTPSPAPDGAEEPDEETEPAPEVVSSPDDIFFRREDEPEEVVIADVEAGHWEYRSDTLSVIVDRHVDEQTPLVWCTAHIRMRERNSFRSIITREISNELRLRAWRLARKTKAVLLITGDNLTTSETSYKGLLIRGDRFYSDRRREDAMTFGDDLGMTILEKGNVDGVTLLESGVTDTYSFGPVLVENGEIRTERIKRHRVAGKENPRCGVGMIEPGHLVAITVDGRQKDYSLGVDLMAFAQMFIDEGCTTAYNLDGGGSTAMVFMGENLNTHGGQNWDKQRYLPEAISWGYSELVPDESDPIENIGSGFGNLTELKY